MSNSISVTILTKNSQKHLFACLSALQDFDEIIVLDNGSTDNTFAIARQFGNAKIFELPFIGFGPLKNLAAQYASNPWVLSIDSDEVITTELKNELLQLDLSNPQVAYTIKRNNYYRNKLIKACGWDNDYVLRLYNKQATNFADLQVHEFVRTDGLQLRQLKGTIDHYSYDSISQLILKSDKYTSLFATENRFIKKSSPFKSYYKWAFAFFRNYILQRGILYGYEGLAISFANAGSAFYKYIKLHEANQTLHISLIYLARAGNSLSETLKTQLVNQTYAPEEVMVVNCQQNSNGNKPELFKINNTYVPVAYINSNVTESTFMNLQQAIVASTGEYIVILDRAVELTPNFLKDLKQSVRKNTFAANYSNDNTGYIAFWKDNYLKLHLTSELPLDSYKMFEYLSKQFTSNGITQI